jgi:hypothetical protein
MSMETFSLLDDEKQSSLREDLTLQEVSKTRLLRVDLGTRSRTDPFQRWLHKHLRALRYWRVSTKTQKSEEMESRPKEGPSLPSAKLRSRWSYQNTILIAEIIGRLTTSTLAIFFLVVPMAVLSDELSRRVQLIVVSVCILTLSFLVSLFLNVSSFEMMAISAAYAAVLSVFVSSGERTN